MQTTPTRPRPVPAKPSADIVKRLDEQAARLWARMDKEKSSAAKASDLQSNPGEPVGQDDTTTPKAARTLSQVGLADQQANRESGGGSGQPAAESEWPEPASAMSPVSLAAILAAVALAMIAGFALLRRRGRAT